MKKSSKYKPNTSIKDLFNHVEPDSYTRQTLVTIFRCFLETIIENRYPSVILAKVQNQQGFQGLLNRLMYTESKVYTYSDNIEGFNQVVTNHPGLENDEFLVIIAERFSACIYWNEADADVFGLCQGFCSMNPGDAKLITEFLQEVAFNEDVKKDLEEILQDRRNNEKFTTILRKLVTNLESRQRDLICANTELKDLYQKSVQAEKLNNIEEFCSTIVHELRNPLGMIDLHAKIISKYVEKMEIFHQEKKEAHGGGVFETLLNSAGLISHTTSHLEMILSELVDYSKPLSVQKTEDKIENTVQEVINLIKPCFEQEKIGIFFENLLEKDFKLLFDKTKLYQALLNIVKNALEISKPGDIVKIICFFNKEDGSVVIKVADEGPGILPEDMEKIFKPFFTTKKQGTGLGLAQTRKIMEAHGGNITVNSTEKQGTTFVLTLPAESAYIYSTTQLTR